MEVTFKLEMHGEQFERLLRAIHSLTEGINRMADATVTGVQALADLTDAVNASTTADAAAIALDTQIIADLAAEVALLNQPGNAADPVKIEALVGQLQANSVARAASNAALTAALATVAPPTTGGGTPPPAPAATSVSVSVDASGLVFTGSVSGSAGVPTGTVTLSDSTGAVSGSAALDSTGSFSITLSSAPADGSYAVNAAYGGDAANVSSNGSVSVTYPVAAPAAGVVGGSTL